MISTPIKIIRDYSNGDSKVTDLIESDLIHNELLTETHCRFGEKPVIDMMKILDSNIDSDIELVKIVNSIKSILVYQQVTTYPNDPIKPEYDYYYYLNDGTKIISLILEPTVNKVEFVFEESSHLPNYEIPLDDDLCDSCYRLLLISLSNDLEFNIVTKVHESSDRPHISYFTDIMTDNDMHTICNQYMYDSNLRDIRNNTLIGKNLSSKLW